MPDPRIARLPNNPFMSKVSSAPGAFAAAYSPHMKVLNIAQALVEALIENPDAFALFCRLQIVLGANIIPVFRFPDGVIASWTRERTGGALDWLVGRGFLREGVAPDDGKAWYELQYAGSEMALVETS